MSIARHHAEWLSLLEISGPFLSMPVLLQAFPQGLDALDSEHARELRAAYEEWADNQAGLRPEPAIHTAWIRYVLANTLRFPDEVIAGGQALPQGLKAAVPEHGLTLRPDLAIIEPHTQAARLLVQIYPASQDLEKAVAGDLWQANPGTRMMTLLHASGVRLGLVTNGEQWLLVNAPAGETTGFISWYASLWLEEKLTLRAFHSLLGVERFFNVPEAQTLENLLAASARDQQEVTDQLGYQVRRAVEILIQAIDRADQDRGRVLLAGLDESVLYEAALTVMMRLVFLLTAEERKLLPLDDPFYSENYAVATLRAQQSELADKYGEELLEYRYDAWSRLLATFRVVHSGLYHDRLTLPAYGGSLFDPNRFPFLEGRSSGFRVQSSELNSEPEIPNPEPGTGNPEPATPLPISNRTVLHLLNALQLLQVKVPGGGPAEARRLSFRALDIEQIGHVYESLLDHTAVRATEPVLGLIGTREKEPEIALVRLEAFITSPGKGSANSQALLDFLKEQTGRSESALKKALPSPQASGSTTAPLDPQQLARLRAACGNDEALLRRVLPWADLIRTDDFGHPVVIPAGSVYMTAGTERRATGTHYTPKALTEPIVQHTLEPLVYNGPAEGKPREEWELRSAATLLNLKICDMAMGSGAFLVQTCRYLSERLVEAWHQIQRSEFKDQSSKQKTRNSELETRNPKPGIQNLELRITPEGKPATGDPGEQLIPLDPEERLILARRLVADRCLYGVDKNPLAVEMAKLSLWLITLDKNRPFTFLDHALKCGDSLVGVNLNQLLCWSLTDTTRRVFETDSIRIDIEQMIKLRRQLEQLPVNTIEDQARKAFLLARAEAIASDLRQGANMLIGSYFNDLSNEEQEYLRYTLLQTFVEGKDALPDRTKQTDMGTLRPFHWPLEFPEVFLVEERKGFDAFVGNPPFLGGLRISTMFGNRYLRYLRLTYPSSTGTADLCALFFLRAFEKLNVPGTFGLIATNTIAQGDTRETGLDYIVKQGGTIYAANSSKSWPGTAAVFVSVVHIMKGKYGGQKILDNKVVPILSPLLDSSTSTLGTPKVLVGNAGKSFIGEYVLGLGFVLEPEEAHALISKNPKNQEVIFPYLNGQDLNSHPEQLPSRQVINFFDWTLEKAEQYPDCMAIVREKVYPQRMAQNDKFGREYWWRYMRSRPEMHEAITLLKRVLVTARVSRTVAFVFVPKGWVYNEKVVVFAFEDGYAFTILQSTYHNLWAWKYSSTLKSDLNYAPTDCFENFPFPHVSNPKANSLNEIGETYHEHRHQIMVARQEGLTVTYNRFHNPNETSADIARLRELHVEMDQAVAAAYGWTDLALGHNFHETAQGMRFTISESTRWEVLGRLLELNHKRYEEEALAGLHEKKRKGKEKKTRPKEDEGDVLQGKLF